MNDDRTGTAYHEAGHAVVAWALGVPVARIAIAVGGDDAAGGTDIGPADHLPTRDQVAICVAGLEAQEIFNAPTHNEAGLSDYAKVISILDEMSEEERIAIRDAAHQRARELILANRVRVVRLAKHLVDKVRIDDAEFLVVINAPRA